MSRTKEGEGAGRGVDLHLASDDPPPALAPLAKPKRAKRQAVPAAAPRGLGTIASPVQPPSPNRAPLLTPAELDLMTPFQRRVAELFEQASTLAHQCGYVWTCSAQDIVSHVEGYLREHPELAAMGHQVVLDTMQTWTDKIEARANGNPNTPEIPASPKGSLNTYLGNAVRFERERRAAPPSQRFGGVSVGLGGPGQPPKPGARAIGPNHGGSYGQPSAPAVQPEPQRDWSREQAILDEMRAEQEAKRAAREKAAAEAKAAGHHQPWPRS